MSDEYITKQQAIDYIKSMEVLIGCTGVSVLTKGIEGMEAIKVIGETTDENKMRILRQCVH